MRLKTEEVDISKVELKSPLEPETKKPENIIKRTGERGGNRKFTCSQYKQEDPTESFAKYFQFRAETLLAKPRTSVQINFNPASLLLNTQS